MQLARRIDSPITLAYDSGAALGGGRMETVLVVGIGGFLGANARYFLSRLVDEGLPDRVAGFPLGTLTVNVIGSFGLALFAVWFSARFNIPGQLRLLLGAGFFGAFTTFSTFASDSLDLLQRDGLLAFLLNIALNNGLCLLAAAAGLLLAQRYLGG